MKKQDLSPSPATRRARLVRPAGLLAAVAMTIPAAHAQSAANWLTSAPLPTRAMLFGSALPAPVGQPAALAASTLPDAPLPDAPSEAYSSSLEPMPEAPEPQLGLEPKPAHGTTESQHIAQKWTMSIPPNWTAQHLTAGQKVKAGLTDIYSFETISGWFLAAGWEQLLNSAPNYGTDKGAFGQRLGASALRSTSQNLFSEVILAPILHQDVRYYVEGDKYGLVHRTLYSVTRPLITRTDSGRETVNASMLLGYAGAAALTPTYYPQINRNFHDVASAFGGGIGGAALGYFITEFSQDTLRALHLAPKP